MIQDQIHQRWPAFGPNKLQELGRLVMEIARREGCPFEAVLVDVPLAVKTFPAVKAALVQRRFPELTAQGIKVSESFTQMEVDPQAAVDLQRARKFSPSKILIEEAAADSSLAGRVRAAFPHANISVIPSYKTAVRGRKVSPREYNRRLDELYIVNERFDHFKPCPCTPGVRSCGYHNVNLGFGCPFECSYCFLQSYTNVPGIVLPANLDAFFAAFRTYRRGIRVGSGETTDSLAFDPLTGFAPQIVDFFREFPESVFEFKTKSDTIDGLLSVKAASNIVAGWSVNPETVVAREEFFTASLKHRLAAAGRAAAHGYRTAFHFDPVVYYPGWEADYAAVVRDIFRAVPRESVAWISLGTLRMTTYQKKMIENRFPATTILLSELLTAPDGKVRYHESVREKITRHLLDRIREASTLTPVYLCMEPAAMWQRLGVTVNWPWKA